MDNGNDAQVKMDGTSDFVYEAAISSANSNQYTAPQSLPSENPRKTSNTTPATIPVISSESGIEYISFTYSTKGSTRTYKIRTDIDSILVSEMPREFKVENCVYPRAFVEKSDYVGNRWEYETTVNTIGWKLCWVNNELVGKRGLIQRAVDSYRNRFPEMKSRRVIRQEKLIKGTLRKRMNSDKLLDDVSSPGSTNPSTPVISTKPLNSNRRERTLSVAKEAPSKKPRLVKYITVDHISGHLLLRNRIHVEFDNIKIDEIPQDFKVRNAVFPRALVSAHEYKGTRYEYESQCNELGWKLAILNVRLDGNKCLLQRTLDVYRKHFDIQQPRRGKRAVEEVTQQLNESRVSSKAVYSSGVIATATVSNYEDTIGLYPNSSVSR